MKYHNKDYSEFSKNAHLIKPLKKTTTLILIFFSY